MHRSFLENTSLRRERRVRDFLEWVFRLEIDLVGGPRGSLSFENHSDLTRH